MPESSAVVRQHFLDHRHGAREVVLRQRDPRETADRVVLHRAPDRPRDIPRVLERRRRRLVSPKRELRIRERAGGQELERRVAYSNAQSSPACAYSTARGVVLAQRALRQHVERHEFRVPVADSAREPQTLFQPPLLPRRARRGSSAKLPGCRTVSFVGGLPSSRSIGSCRRLSSTARNMSSRMLATIDSALRKRDSIERSPSARAAARPSSASALPASESPR